jgi:hypothetical protein
VDDETETCVVIVLAIDCNTAPLVIELLGIVFAAVANAALVILPEITDAPLILPLAAMICVPVLLKNPEALIVANVRLPTFKLNWLASVRMKSAIMVPAII